MEQEVLNQEADVQLARLRAGDRDAMSYVQRRLYNRMLMAAYQRLENRDEAENAAQEALLKVWTNRDRLPETWAEAKSYILRMAANCASDVRRKPENKVATVPIDEALLSIAPVSDHDTNSETLDVFLADVARGFAGVLKPRQAHLLRLMSDRLGRPYRSIDEVYRDVGDASGLSWASVRNEWSRIGQALKAHCERPLPDEAVREVLRLLGGRELACA